MPKVMLECGDVMAFCTPSQIQEVTMRLKRTLGDEKEEIASCSGESNSPIAATPGRFGTAASTIASFVEETHVFIGGRCGAAVSDLRHCANHLRRLTFKALGDQRFKVQRNSILATLKRLDHLSSAYDELRHF